MIVDRRNEEGFDQFPVGMRVLAVDDDPICLRLLETLLRKCQYHVTTRDRAIDALELLRENRDKFDLVISDVHMPDMDGFKLLELVGLEMDLPVIMLSANGDTKLVMKGITHGACDYLLKPVRLEELKNIWQHVIRRKKLDKKDQKNREKRSYPADEGQRYSKMGDSDQDGRLGKRRKDQDEDDDEDGDENAHDNDDSSSQKKSRVVWSVELHRKFVAAVNQLGFDRAVPKKILELMNVEKLTRENVASHLQKYRLYLKRLSSVANQQAHMVAALGGADPAYLRMNFHNFNGSGQFPNNALRSLPPVGALSRLNTPVGLGIHGLSPSGIGPLGHAQMPRSPFTDTSKFQLHNDQAGSILQGMPTSLGFDQLQTRTGLFSTSSGAIDPKNTALSNRSVLLQGQGGFGDQDLHISPDVSRLGSGSQTAMLDSNGARNLGFASKHLWHDHKLDMDFTNSTGNPSMAAQGASSSTPVGDPTGAFFGASNEFSTVGHSSLDSSSAQHMAAGFHGMDSAPNLGGFAVNRAGSLEDIVSSMIKWEQEDAALNRGSDLGGDAYPLGTCI